MNYSMEESFDLLGISVRLPSVPFGIWGRLRGWHPDVFYVKEEGFWRSYWRAIRDNFLLKVPLPPWRFAEMVRYCAFLVALLAELFSHSSFSSLLVAHVERDAKSFNVRTEDRSGRGFCSAGEANRRAI